MYTGLDTGADARPVPAGDHERVRTRALTAAGAAVFAAATAALLLTGHTEIQASADAEAPPIPLAGAVLLPLAAGLVLTRLVPRRLPVLAPAGAADRPALARQAGTLVGLALGFSLLVLVVGGGVLYAPAKLAVLAGGAWWVLRRWRADPGADRHRAALGRRWRLLGPVPAVLAWGYLAHYGPNAGDQDLTAYRDLDRAFLIGAMILTFLTASVLEEVFYRIILQTRLEALLGRWPAIMATALLFAAMHTHRFTDGPLWPAIAVVVVFNGGFGLFVGYLWARYRAAWAIIAVHAAVNALALLPIVVN